MKYQIFHRTKLFIIIIIASIVASACTDSEQESTTEYTPEAIHNEDTCHVCGMNVARFPGPKAQAFIIHQQHSFKFCSTQDMFSWLLQPETTAVVQKVYVHDMGMTDWDRPTDDAFIDATQAWYVTGHDRRGAMGPTLASFSQLTEADSFIAEHGGRVLQYESIDMEILLGLE